MKPTYWRRYWGHRDHSNYLGAHPTPARYLSVREHVPPWAYVEPPEIEVPDEPVSTHDPGWPSLEPLLLLELRLDHLSESQLQAGREMVCPEPEINEEELIVEIEREEWEAEEREREAIRARLRAMKPRPIPPWL